MSAPPPGGPGATYALSEQRERNLRAGVAWFGGWLADQLTFGLAAIESDPRGRLDEAAARLTDAQLPGPAGALRDWGGRIGEVADWPEGLLREFGYWHLLCALARDLEGLPPEQRDGVLGALGVNIRRSVLEAAAPVAFDRWACVGVEAGESANVHFRRTYWSGTSLAHRAVQLDFNYGSPVPAGPVSTGTAGEFGVRAYPGGLPGRILAPAGYTPALADAPPAHHATWGEERSANAALLARKPWRRDLPLAVGPLRVALAGRRVVLLDARGEAVALAADRDAAAVWGALAIAGGTEAVGYGVWRSGRPHLHAVWADAAMRATG